MASEDGVGENTTGPVEDYIADIWRDLTKDGFDLPDWIPKMHWPQCTLYDDSNDYGIPCGEVTLPCQYVPLAKLFRPFKSGQCSKHRYSVQTHSVTVPIVTVGDVKFSMFEKRRPSTRTCKVNLPVGMLCGQFEAQCDVIPAMKAFVGYSDGECSSSSYKLIPGTTGPVMEGQGLTFEGTDLIFSAFIDKALPVPEMSGRTCSIFDEGDSFAHHIGIGCGELKMDCSMVEHAKLLRESFKDGECAGAGYSRQFDSHNFWVPLAGDVAMTFFRSKHADQQTLVV